MPWQKWIRFTLTVLLLIGGADAALGSGEVACARFFANLPVSQEALSLAIVTADFFSADPANRGIPSVAYRAFGQSWREDVSFPTGMVRQSLETPTAYPSIEVRMGDLATRGAALDVIFDGEVFISIAQNARLNRGLLSLGLTTIPLVEHGPLADDFAFAVELEGPIGNGTSLTIFQRILRADGPVNRSVTLSHVAGTRVVAGVELRETQLLRPDMSPVPYGTGILGWSRLFRLRPESSQ